MEIMKRRRLPPQCILSFLLFVLFREVKSFAVTTMSLALPNKSHSVGQAIQVARTAHDLLQVASSLWLPTDPNIAPHLQSQRVHHEKRQRWSAQLLERLGGTMYHAEQEDTRLTRAILGASIPFESDRWEKEGVYVKQALLGLHCMFGNSESIKLADDAVEGVRQLIARAIAMAPYMPLSKVVEIRWASRGIISRLNLKDLLDLSILDDLVAGLPFDIIPLGLDWTEIVPSNDVVATLRSEIPFNFDTIVTRTGSTVTERRATTWLADSDIGALAYSGKLMTPNPIPSVVGATMRAVERALCDFELASSYFDCALCNHYPDAEAACKFHTDPEHGTFWERLTCVVAAGDARRFAFRPIPGMTAWNEWESSKQRFGINIGEAANAPAVIHLFSGDIVKMWGTCNDDFYHAVYAAEGEAENNGRVSLVLKRAMSRGNGKRGHGLAGEGRRSKRRSEGGIDSDKTQRPSKARRPKPRRS